MNLVDSPAGTGLAAVRRYFPNLPSRDVGRYPESGGVWLGGQIANEAGIMSASRLRERAARCRRLAQLARDDGIALELEKLACDYERDADPFEASNLHCASDRVH